jgi:hypothetical protein
VTGLTPLSDQNHNFAGDRDNACFAVTWLVHRKLLLPPDLTNFEPADALPIAVIRMV